MRTFVLLLVCIGAGFLIAYQQHCSRTNKISNFFGTANVTKNDRVNLGENDNEKKALEAVVEAEKNKKRGRIEVVGGLEYDFGMMMKGSRRSHKFVFRNVGGADALVKFKSSTCKCTVGKFSNATLKPGEETDVELEWKAEAEFDEFRQTATIETDCPEQEEIKLVIKGQIGETFVIDPPSHGYGNFYSNEETIIPFTVYSFEDSPINLFTGAIQDAVLSKKIKIEIGEERKLEKGEIPHMADAKHAVDCKVRIDKGVSAGPINMVIKLARRVAGPEDNLNEFISYNIRATCVTPVRIIASNDYQENRNIWNLGSAKSRDGLEKKLLLAIKNDGEGSNPNVRIGKARPDALKATVEEIQVTEAQRIYRLTVQIPPGTEPIELDGTFSKDFGQVVVETDLEVAPRIPIFVKFRITE